MFMRMLVSNVKKNGQVEYSPVSDRFPSISIFNSRGNDILEVPKSEEKKEVCKNLKEFINKIIDYFEDGAVWINGICWVPVFVCPFSFLDRKKWNRQEGMLLKAETHEQYHSAKRTSNDLLLIEETLQIIKPTLPAEVVKKLMINCVLWNSRVSKSNLHPLSQYRDVKYKNIQEMRISIAADCL